MIIGNYCPQCGKWLWSWDAKIRHTTMSGNVEISKGKWMHATCGFKIMDKEARKEFIESFREKFGENEKRGT